MAKSIDPNAEVYLFGSVAEGRHLLSSDIDVLAITAADPGLVLERLWRAGIGDPFKIHVSPRDATPLPEARQAGEGLAPIRRGLLVRGVFAFPEAYTPRRPKSAGFGVPARRSLGAVGSLNWRSLSLPS